MASWAAPEMDNIETEDFELVPPGSWFTDDTVMTLGCGEWLMTDCESIIEFVYSFALFEI